LFGIGEINLVLGRPIWYWVGSLIWYWGEKFGIALRLTVSAAAARKIFPYSCPFCLLGTNKRGFLAQSRRLILVGKGELVERSLLNSEELQKRIEKLFQRQPKKIQIHPNKRD
jgi:hypothetical protein